MSAGSIMPHYAVDASPPGVPALEDMLLDSSNEIGPVYSLAASGDILTAIEGDALADAGDWLSPKSGMGGFEARATLVSGGVAVALSDDLSTWLGLGGADLEWHCRNAGPTRPAQNCVLSIEIRPVGGAVAASCTVNMGATFTE
jgi:hypothetical protein